MWLRENPVLQRELIVNLRTPRAFLLLLFFQLVLSAVVLIAYPRDAKIVGGDAAKKLVDFFLAGQFILTSLMAPSFAAGSITGEKERKTYEMLLASPLSPTRIVMGKLIASLTHLFVLMIASLPIIMLCLPLGGVSPLELLITYPALLCALIFFGSVSILCSSYFKRTSASLVVSYLILLPMLLLGFLLWRLLALDPAIRLPGIALASGLLLVASLACLGIAARRLLYPPDVGSQGSEVVDLEKEQQEAVGLVLQRDQFPDRLFAPPRRKTLMQDGANPVYDKEIHAELFSQGTLMLRLVIQISMLLAIPLMAFLLFFRTSLSSWYMEYVAIFNILVAPVFTAGSISSERERQTLDLLLTTTIAPLQILWGKWLAGFRVSFVLTAFLFWPVFLAFLLNPDLSRNWASVLAYIAIILISATFNSVLALLCSTLFRRTSVSMMYTYAILLLLYLGPIAIWYLVSSFSRVSAAESWQWLGAGSPLAAIQAVPFGETFSKAGQTRSRSGNLPLLITYFAATASAIAAMVMAMVMLFRDRWRLTGHD